MASSARGYWCTQYAGDCTLSFACTTWALSLVPKPNLFVCVCFLGKTGVLGNYSYFYYAQESLLALFGLLYGRPVIELCMQNRNLTGSCFNFSFCQTGFRGPYIVLGTEHMSAACKAITYPLCYLFGLWMNPKLDLIIFLEEKLAKVT